MHNKALSLQIKHKFLFSGQLGLQAMEHNQHYLQLVLSGIVVSKTPLLADSRKFPTYELVPSGKLEQVHVTTIVTHFLQIKCMVSQLGPFFS